ncbi:M48 family metallopeptidase [Aliiroseovarius marinus]|uniref:M48 family metallopeptidase n=1 Tax=Aliiroseovarius marinus TaxID=2500159 RepID=UPI003D7CDEC0
MTTLDSPNCFADLAQGDRAHLTRVGVSLGAEGLAMDLPDGDRIVWAWEQLRALRDQADRDGLVVAVAKDPLRRLYLKDDRVIADLKARALHLSRRDRLIPLRKIAAWAAGAVASVAAIIFFLVPIMAAQLAALLPPEGEKALGDATFEQIRTALSETGFDGTRICDAPDGVAAMQAMYDRLDPSDDLPYEVKIHILDHDMVNAFALPGGRLVFFRGLLEEAENAEEVAAVLAHEIGHVVNRDPTRDALRSAGSLGVLGLLFGDFAGGTIALFLANQLINASYSQAAEAAADDYAHELLEKSNLSPHALGSFFDRLKAEHGDAEGIIAHFASHPQMADRIAAAQAAVDPDRAYGKVLDQTQWHALKAVCASGSARQSDEAIPEKKNWP